MPKVLVVADHYKGRLKKSTLSAINFAGQAGDVYIAVIGCNIDAVADELKGYGAVRIYVINDPALEHYLAYEYSIAIEGLVKKIDAEYVAMTTSTTAKDLLPFVAMRLNAGMASDIIGYDDNIFTRHMNAGNAVASVKISTPVKVVSVLGTSFCAAVPTGGETLVEEIHYEIPAGKAKWIAMNEIANERPELTEANIIVSGGRGIKGSENKPIIEKLADKLGASIGWTRAAVDAGWAPNDLQVGQTGKIVAPKLYIAVGISGAIQHLAGIKDSKVIVAINRDEEAPIFSVADYGIVGDLFSILPELTQKMP